MTLPRDAGLLQDIIDHASEARAFVAGRRQADLESDRQLALAIVRLLEIVGEAASAMSSEFRERHPQVPWRLMIGMRNRLIHGYQTVDLETVWDVVDRDLPPLIQQLRDIQSS